MSGQDFERRLDPINDRIARRLDPINDRIEVKRPDGLDVADWEAFWMALLRSYEDLCAELDQSPDD